MQSTLTGVFLEENITTTTMVKKFLPTAMGYLLRIIFVCLVLFENVSSNDEHPVLKTKLGKVRGSVLKSQNGKSFFAFRGIPYAEPPVKKLRFEPPVPVSKWEGELDATEDGHTCIQFDLLRKKLVGDEDCLFLNVYTSQLTPTTLKPVMVWIHGGGFACGDGSSSMYGPDKLMDKDIVLVAINYRVSALGFLSTGDSVLPGNYGLLDQVQALKWVQENIDTFGGDPNSVTIFGESAGGASVIFHVISPLSKGLFHGAIAQSGTATSPWALVKNPLEQTKILAKLLRCPTDCIKKLVNCLKKRPALDIAVESSWMKLYDPLLMKTSIWTPLFLPVIDKGLRNLEFLPSHPEKLLTENKVNRVPVIIGVNKDEGFMFLYLAIMRGRSWNDLANATCSDSIMESFHSFAPDSDIELKETMEKMCKIYFSTIKDDSGIMERITALNDLFGDVYFSAAADLTVDSLVAGGVPTFPYKFTHKGSVSLASLLTKNDSSDIDYAEKLNIVSHGDDLAYLFNSEVLPAAQELNEKDKQVEDIILTSWTNFAKNKVPSLDGSNLDFDFKWTPMQSGKPSYLDLNHHPRMVPGYFATKSEVFKKLHLKEEL